MHEEARGAFMFSMRNLRWLSFVTDGCKLRLVDDPRENLVTEGRMEEQGMEMEQMVEGKERW